MHASTTDPVRHRSPPDSHPKGSALRRFKVQCQVRRRCSIPFRCRKGGQLRYLAFRFACNPSRGILFQQGLGFKGSCSAAVGVIRPLGSAQVREVSREPYVIPCMALATGMLHLYR